MDPSASACVEHPELGTSQTLRVGRDVAKQVHYFDPDCHLFWNLDLIQLHLHSRSFVITPHETWHTPDDGEWQTDLQLMRVGIYNYGDAPERPSSSARPTWHLQHPSPHPHSQTPSQCEFKDGLQAMDGT